MLGGAIVSVGGLGFTNETLGRKEDCWEDFDMFITLFCRDSNSTMGSSGGTRSTRPTVKCLGNFNGLRAVLKSSMKAVPLLSVETRRLSWDIEGSAGTSRDKIQV